MTEFLQRFNLMLEEGKLKDLQTRKVILFGVGGVGGYVAEMLVRSGIKNLTIVDFDKVDITNLNRQIVALHSTIGEIKVEVLASRLKDINPDIKLTAICKKVSKDNLLDFNLNQYDYVIDCIDDMPAKQEIIKFCNLNDIELLVSCGAGNRYQSLPYFEVCDIKKTSYDKLAKLLRKFCVEEKINKLTVCYTKEPPLKLNSTTIGSVVYYPVSMACSIVCYVINKLLNKN